MAFSGLEHRKIQTPPHAEDVLKLRLDPLKIQTMTSFYPSVLD